MKKILLLAAVVLVIFGVSAALKGTQKVSPKPVAGRRLPTAPDFTLKDLNGKDVTLSSFRGKEVLLIFGATWCPYCVAEVPELNAFYEKHRDEDVKVFSIDIEESAVKVAAFVSRHKIKYTVLLDSDGKVAERYNVYGIPAVYFVDKNGIIKYSGPRPKRGFEALLK